MSEKTIESFLKAARRRHWMQLIVSRIALGATIGSALALLLCILALRLTALNGSLYAAAAIAAGALVGLAAGALSRESLKGTALRIDEAARLKDRLHTALQLSVSEKRDEYCLLQLRDAAQAIRNSKVTGLFPWRWPREGTLAVVSGVLAVLAITMLPAPQQAQATMHQTPVAVQSEAAVLAEQIEEMEKLAEELDSREMHELAAKLKEMLKDMAEKTPNAEQAMLKLARMTAAVDASAAQFDPLLLEQAMQDLAEGLTGLEGFEQLAQLIKQEQYDRAAKAAESFGQGIGSGQRAMPSSGGLTETRLGQLADQAQAAGLSELSEALSSLQKAVRSGSRSECQGALGRLGKSLGKYGKRLKIGQVMRAQLNNLNECKQCLNSGYCKGCKNGGSCSGGNCMGVKTGPPQLSSSQSKSPSQSAGTAVSMNKFGNPTELRGNRRQEHVSGQLGHGDSDKETEVSPDGKQSAATAYRKVYGKYQKLSDAVIAEEATPLAHRQTIKRYFELIHPDRVDPATQLKDVRLDQMEPKAKSENAKKDGAE